MLILDPNMFIRGVLGRRVRALLEAYGIRGVRFYSPERCFVDAEEYLPALLQRRGKSVDDLASALAI